MVKFSVIFILIFINLLPVIAGIAYLAGSYRNLISPSDQISALEILISFPYWIGLIIILEAFLYILATDLILFVSRWLTFTPRENWIKWIALDKIGILIFFIIYVPVRTWWDTNKIKVSTFEIAVNGLSPVMYDLNLVLTADVQVDRYTTQNKIDSFIRKVNTLSPDFLFFAGDLVTNGTYYIDKGIEVMCQTQANMERILCIGDHDIWSNAEKISRGLENCGWKFLDDAHHLVEYKSKTILVTGVSYVYSKRISPPKLQQLMESAPDVELKILLVHQPSKMVIDYATKYGYHLLLAGHTHGGQIVFRPFGLTLTPTLIENNMFTGVNNFKGLNVVVTNGLGMSLVPVRYQAQAEIVQLKLIPFE
jgi:predicted MPP superfamily phosphohydrolase